MRNFYLFTILFLLPFLLKAQNIHSIKGIAGDASLSVKLPNTTISILNSKDSTLYKFTRAGADGSFAMGSLKTGKFIVLVTYPGYADYVEHFKLDSANREKNFGSLNMVLKENLLKDVIIKGEAIAIKIKGDTTEFNAAAYNIEPNSKVEDLLKQLPGIQIDKDGKITAQGKTVEKVLVDGEEFFGDDPTLVTKNLRGDMVDKVQLFDKKSDQATFTGIDDGEKTKTLNIQLKEDKKKGYFGKASAGIATDEFFEGQAMANFFKAKKKFAVYGTMGNTGQTGLGFEDGSKFGASALEFSDEGYFRFNGGDEFESFDGRYNGQGIPDAKTGGVHYDSKWNKDKESINTNYTIGSIGVGGIRDMLNQNNLPTGTLISNSGQQFNKSAFRQKLDATYQLKIDSTSNLKISVNGTLKNTENNNIYDATSIRGNSVLLNNSKRSLSNDGEEQLFNVSAFWNKKLKKSGRTVSLTLSNSLNKNQTAGFLNSVNSFYDNQGLEDSTQFIDQYKTTASSGSVLSSNLAYTEPITKSLSLIVNYGLGLNNSSIDRRSFNKSPLDEYDIPDPTFSNNFSLKQVSNQAGAIFNYRKDKTVLNFGSKAAAVNFNQVDELTGVEYKREFINVNPQASLQYKLGKQKNLRASYYGRTTQPSIAQMQPIRINDDPLNITLGNPDLKPSFSSSFNLSYDSYKVLTNQYLYVNGSYSFTSNAIVNDLFTDSAGKSTFQSVNSSGKMPSSFYLSANTNRKISKAGLSVGLQLSANGNTYHNFINNELNTTNSYNFSGGLSLRQYVEKKFSFSLQLLPNYTEAQSSLQKQINNNGWGFNSNGYFSVNLPGKVEIASDASYQFKGRTQSFNEDFARLIWNSTISKKFMKADALKLSLSGKDLLNQNIGFSRYASSNMITQSSYSTIKRYFMLALVYDFNKMGAGVPSK